MSNRLSFLSSRRAWVSCLACVVMAGVLRAADPRPAGRSIEITEPRHDTVGTNVNQLRGAGLKNLEEDLARPLRSFNFEPETSLSGAAARPLPPQVPTQSQRVRALNEWRRNWAFGTPEEIMAGPSSSADDVFGLSGLNANDDKNQTPMERYYDRMFGKHSTTTTNYFGKSGQRGTADSTGRWDDYSGDATTDEFGNLKKIRSGLLPESYTPSVVSRGFGDMFRFNADRVPSPETLRAQEEQRTRIENFKKIWNPPPAAVVAPVISTPGGTPAWGGGPAVYSSAQPKPFSAPSGNSSFSGLPSSGGSPAVAPPQPARTAPQQPLEMNAPRRPF